MTPEESKKLAKLEFPFTEELLMAAIHLCSPTKLEKLLNNDDLDFDAGLNEEAILVALIHALHHRKRGHAKVLSESQFQDAPVKNLLKLYYAISGLAPFERFTF